MDFAKVKKLFDEDCECRDCEIHSANDDQTILVSVSPRRFKLPTGTEKRAKMKIKNRNPYLIYFQAGTSNMDVFRASPNIGLIPPHKEVSVDVKFCDSAMPLRRHEEVIVFTSVKPFEQLASCKEQFCPYCMESFDISKHHMKKDHSHADCKPHTDGSFSYNSHRSYKKNDKLSRYAVKDYQENNVSRGADFEMKYKVPKQKAKFEYDSKFQGKKETRKLQEKKKENMTDYAQTYPKIPHSYERVYNDRDYSVRKTKHTIVSHELQEICFHALVHRPSAGGCECKNCIELFSNTEDVRKMKCYLKPEKQWRKMENGEDTSEDRLHRNEKDFYTLHPTKDRGKGKGREGHILTRILRAEWEKELSDTDLSELSTSYLLTKCTKIISEEDFKKKKEKLKKKLLKRYAEESESTTTEESRYEQKESDEKTTKMERKTTLKLLDKKCNFLINLSWANLFLVLLLMLTVVGGFTYCC